MVANGEVIEGSKVGSEEGQGHWKIKVEKRHGVPYPRPLSRTLRGHFAHSTPVVVKLKDSPFRAAADAVSILEQIEGSMAYLDTVGTRAENKRYKEMRMILESAHRSLHNRMHALGHYHEHSPIHDHGEHH